MIKASAAKCGASRAGRTEQHGLGTPTQPGHCSLMRIDTALQSLPTASLECLQPSVTSTLLPNRACPEKPAVLFSYCCGFSKTSNTAGELASFSWYLSSTQPAGMEERDVCCIAEEFRALQYQGGRSVIIRSITVAKSPKLGSVQNTVSQVLLQKATAISKQHTVPPAQSTQLTTARGAFLAATVNKKALLDYRKGNSAWELSWALE